MTEKLTREDRAAAIEVLTAWNGSRVSIVWAVDKFPEQAKAMIDAARRVLVREVTP